MEEKDVRFRFEFVESQTTAARLGHLFTPHGRIDTPVFMPVGTAGTVKAVPHEMLRGLGIQLILANTYHLYLRPGHELIKQLGGLHRFIAWERGLLTDSGGYQILSLKQLRTIDEEGVTFRSHLDGSKHFISPELAIDIQTALGADIVMALDDCTPYPSSYEMTRQSLELTLRWAERCKTHFNSSRQALFGIVQGGIYPELRRLAVERIERLGFDGLAIGGLSVGEPKDILYEITEQTVGWLPKDKPRYLMGVGTPEDLVECVSLGIDMFDCVLPTRNARNGYLFTSKGKIIIKNARHAKEDRPLDDNCACVVCRTYSRAYLRHLYVSGEILSSILNTYHNLYFYLDIMKKIRQAIASNTFIDFKKEFLNAIASK